MAQKLKKVIIRFRAPLHLRRRLMRVAKKEGLCMSEWVRRRLEAALRAAEEE